MKRLLFILLFVIACSETEREKSTSTDEECDYACEFVEESYRCHKYMLGYEHIPDYKNEFKEQSDDCDDFAYSVYEMIEEGFEDMAICWYWLDGVRTECNFSDQY